MARATAAAAAQTAQQILTAATELFTARGYAGVSLDDVAVRAQVTRGAIYHHYRNKAGLFRVAAQHLQAQVAERVVEAAEDAGTDPRAQLRAGSHAFLDAVTAGPVSRILLVDAPAVVGWQEWRRIDAESSGRHLREALTEVGIDDGILDALTAQLSGAMNEAALWIAQNSGSKKARTAAHTALDQLLDAVRP